MKSALFFSFFMVFFFSTTTSFAFNNDNGTPVDLCSAGEEFPAAEMQTWDFDLTVGVNIRGAYVEITFHVHCESDLALVTWIGTSGAYGCDVARGITNPNGKGGGKKYRDREAFIRALEDMVKMERGTLTSIKVKKSSAFKADGTVYQIVPGMYKLDRKSNYPLIFPFQVQEVKATELNKDLMRKKETSQLKSFSKIGN